MIRIGKAMILIADNLILVQIHEPRQIKRMKSISYQTENQLSAFLKLGGCNQEQLSLQFCIRMMSQIDLLRSSVEEKHYALFCCRSKIEIKHLFS